MIVAETSKVKFTGTVKELCLEFTHIILGFKSILLTEFNLSEDESCQVIKLCGEIAFMAPEERQQYLNSLINKTEEGD